MSETDVDSSDAGDYSAYSSGSSRGGYISERSSDSDAEDVEAGHNLGIQPYQFEPLPGEIRADHDNDDEHMVQPDDIADRLGNLHWCTCDNCQIMSRAIECHCCKEIPQVERRMAEDPGECKCIIEHPGFDAVCLNKHVLDVAWLQYKQQYGRAAYEGPAHKRYRHIAYRQLVRWCWVFLGKNVRVVLPACAVTCIRAHFPPPGHEEDFEFIGFQHD